MKYVSMKNSQPSSLALELRTIRTTFQISNVKDYKEYYIENSFEVIRLPYIREYFE